MTKATSQKKGNRVQRKFIKYLLSVKAEWFSIDCKMITMFNTCNKYKNYQQKGGKINIVTKKKTSMCSITTNHQYWWIYNHKSNHDNKNCLKSEQF